MKTLQNSLVKGFLLLFLVMSVACGGSKACNGKLAGKDCPPDGKCSVVVHKGKAMVIKTDEFGKPYYEMETNNDKNVIVYTYDRHIPKDVQDGSYREEVVVELDKNQQSASLTSKVAKNGIKALFGRFCYCKGSTGYYKINEGNLILSQAKDQKYTLDFKITEVPQVIQKIQFSTK